MGAGACKFDKHAYESDSDERSTTVRRMLEDPKYIETISPSMSPFQRKRLAAAAEARKLTYHFEERLENLHTTVGARIKSEPIIKSEEVSQLKVVIPKNAGQETNRKENRDKDDQKMDSTRLSPFSEEYYRPNSCSEDNSGISRPIELVTESPVGKEGAVDVNWEKEVGVDEENKENDIEEDSCAFDAYKPGSYKFIRLATIRKSRKKDASVIRTVKIDEVLRIRTVVQEEHRLGYIEIWGKHKQGWIKLRSIHHLAVRVSDAQSDYEIDLTDSEESSISLNYPETDNELEVIKDIRNNETYQYVTNFWYYGCMLICPLGFILLIALSILTRDQDTLTVDSVPDGDRLGTCSRYVLTPITIILLGCIGNILFQVYIFGKDAVGKVLKELFSPCFDTLAGRKSCREDFVSGSKEAWGVTIDDDWKVTKVDPGKQFWRKGIEKDWRVREITTFETGKVKSRDVIDRMIHCEMEFIIPTDPSLRSRVFYCYGKVTPHDQKDGKLNKWDVYSKSILLPAHALLFFYQLYKDLTFVFELSDTFWGVYQCYGLVLFNSSNFRATLFSNVFATLQGLYTIVGDFENEVHPLQARVVRYTVLWSLGSSYFYFALLSFPVASHIIPGFVIFFWFPFLVFFCCLAPLVPILQIVMNNDNSGVASPKTKARRASVRPISTGLLTVSTKIKAGKKIKCREVCPRVNCSWLSNTTKHIDATCLKSGAMIAVIIGGVMIMIAVPVLILLTTVLFLSLQYEMMFRFYNGSSIGKAFTTVWSYRLIADWWERTHTNSALIIRTFV